MSNCHGDISPMGMITWDLNGLSLVFSILLRTFCTQSKCCLRCPKRGKRLVKRLAVAFCLPWQMRKWCCQHTSKRFLMFLEHVRTCGTWVPRPNLKLLSAENVLDQDEENKFLRSRFVSRLKLPSNTTHFGRWCLRSDVITPRRRF